MPPVELFNVIVPVDAPKQLTSTFDNKVVVGAVETVTVASEVVKVFTHRPVFRIIALYFVVVVKLVAE